ncbi:Hpt domain-containing protein [Roseicitreum antarcticum]|uniref:Hpt domain-containing protein n=1 Tax=Roseicitreum antarcticum TaxID=564137 RepID=A0A1H2X3D7_9RHOB|nr:Hpt domain-containing protein [Roseicitreum antarcticum]SDW87297.1 Hpt domain-containing protein [Roseicitreum antarcticum]
MINWDRLEELQTDVGADAFGPLSAIFLEEVDEAVLTLRGTAGGRPANQEERFHALKGAALTLGFDVLAAACAGAEAQAARGLDAAAHVPEITRLYAESRRLFMQDMARQGTDCAAARTHCMI